MSNRRTPGQRAGLTRQAVLAAARQLARREGADALTMRAVARSLGVAPNALYSHVPDKNALVDAVLDDVLGEVEMPEAEPGDPVEGLVRLLASSYDALVQHPELVPVYLARQGSRGPSAVRLGEVMDALLSRAGLAAALVPRVRTVLIIHTLGFAAFAVDAPVESEGRRPLTAGEARAAFVDALRWLLLGATDGAGDGRGGVQHRPDDLG